MGNYRRAEICASIVTCSVTTTIRDMIKGGNYVFTMNYEIVGMILDLSMCQKVLYYNSHDPFYCRRVLSSHPNIAVVIQHVMLRERDGNFPEENAASCNATNFFCRERVMMTKSAQVAAT